MIRRPLASAVVLVALLAVLAACGSSATPPPSTAVASAAPTDAPTPTPTPEPTPRPSPTEPPEYQAPEDLAVGDCYDPVEDADDQALLAVIIVPCDRAHLHEVFGLIELPAGPSAPFPGDDAIEDDSIDRCDAEFEDYVGVDINDSRYGYVYYTPSEATWADGDRALMCAVEDRGKVLEGSVEGTAR